MSKPPPAQPLDVREFVAQLDAAQQAHLDWTRRILRCAVLREDPGTDVMAADAHGRCRFGEWLARARGRFVEIDAAGARRLERNHREMHDAVRDLCRRVLADEPGRTLELEAFERSQSALMADLAHFKTEMLARSVQLDPLTGLPLRHRLADEFRDLRAQSARRGEALVLMLIDADHFKRINDEHGHATGDRALRHLATILRAQLRTGDKLLRYGGEEFLALVQVTGPDAAATAAERLLQGLRAAPMPLDGDGALGLRASIGLAEVGVDEDLSSALARADLALYDAKAAGRDRWRWAAPWAPSAQA
jgi:diguanylate cyclase (GGDEF)-like protein